MKSQELSAFEKVSSNLDILQTLFQFLDIGDQFRFATLTQQLQFAFRNFIWQDINYKKVKLKKYSDTIRLKDAQRSLDYDLTYEEYGYFLNIFGQQVEELNESHGNALTMSMQLKNLTSIKYSYLLITKQQIQLVAQMCPQLQELCINGCCNKKYEILRLGIDIDLHSLLIMPKLKSFSLQTGLDYKIKYGFMEDLMKKTKLPLISNSRIENLNIYMPILATRFLSFFARLHKLTITVFHAASNNDIIALSHACPQLRELTFHFTSFEDIERFSCLQTLRNLSFYHCDGLTYENLREILTRLQLLTFTSIHTKYEGIFHYYFLAPTLTSVYIDAIKSFYFETEMEFYRSRKKVF